MTNWEGEEDNRPFFDALVFEQDGDLNLTWLFVLVMGAFGSLGFIWVNIIAPLMGIVIPVLIQIASWSFLAGAFASVLIAAIPLAKAKILANSKLPADFAKSVASVAQAVETSTDVQELSTKSQEKTDEV